MGSTRSGEAGEIHSRLRRERWALLRHVNDLTEQPMIALSFAWVGLLILDFTAGLSPLLQAVSNLIWALFVLDFGIEILIAPDRKRYLRRNWLTALSLLLPAVRILRVFRAFRLLQAARATRSVGLLRVLTSLNRGMRATRATLGRHGIGYVVVLTVVVTLAGAAGMARFESPAALRESGAPATGGLKNYGDAVWWTAMVMTTMGSDYSPKTAEGRILAWLLSLYAFAIFGYITATIASHFVGSSGSPGGEPASAEAGPDAEITVLRREVTALRTQVAALVDRLETRPATGLARRPAGPLPSRPGRRRRC